MIDPNFHLIQDTIPAQLPSPETVPPVVVESPLPGGVAQVFRFFFNLPQWFEIAGFFFGLVVAAVVAWFLWTRRQAIVEWVKTRQRGVQLTLAAGVLVLVLGTSAAGLAGWDYMQHDNGFCTGCHVMNQPFGQFEARAGKHDSLQCHACHQQSMYANVRQLYLWVAERPDEIKAHATVPNAVCANCHITGEGKEKWKNIAATAGHRVHLESDSSALADVQCVTCHGYEVHLFIPEDLTCSQSGCHDVMAIKLGEMAADTSLHCTTCHAFTAEVPALASYDDAVHALVPTGQSCLSCHDMQTMLGNFDAAKDPHNGTCGDCHNPHTQVMANEAASTCTTSGCHADYRNDPFHSGLSHADVANDCLVCHNPHQARVDPSDCQGCHAKVRATGHFDAPLPFDTLSTLRRARGAPPGPSATGPISELIGGGAEWGPPLSTSYPPASQAAVQLHATSMLAPAGTHAEPVSGFIGGGAEWELPFFVSSPRWDRALTVHQADSFPHERHEALACLTCHTMNQSHGGLTFQAPRGCQICHHVAERDRECSACHQPDELEVSYPETLSVTVPEQRPRARQVAFQHQGPHAAVECLTCHGTDDVTLEPAVEVITCAACHEDHHANPTNCSTCHTGADLTQPHAPPVDAHEGCDACHTPTVVAELVPTRNLCLTCHAPQVDHYVTRECSVCHFLQDPAAYRAHLIGGNRSQ